jgi:LacI family transcriptional regulator
MNLADVAKRAKVSTATVSRVLNNIGLVKESTRLRVLKAAKELHYHPNLHARTLAGGQNRTLGMVVSNLENPFFLDIFRSLECEAHRQGYELLVSNTDYQPQRLTTCIQTMMGRRPAGLAIIVSEMEPSLLREVSQAGLPVILLDAAASQPNFTSIRVAYGKGMDRTLEYLHDLGHRRMAFIGHHTSLGPLSVRKQSFLDAMARFAPEVEFTTEVDQDGPEGGRQACRRLLISRFEPTAIVCVNDYMALGVLRELRDQGLSVPRDVSVTGFDNIRLAEFASPSLTTADIPREKIGHLIFEALAPEARGEREVVQEIVIDPALIVRESTGPCRAS